MLKIVLFLSSLVILNACISFTRTSAGGIRVKNPDRLKFQGEQFHLTDTLLIDTNAVYVLSNFELPHAKPFEISRPSYLRFFAAGQVLIVKCDSIPSLEMINNVDIGWQGYFKIEKNRLMIKEFEIINGGQTAQRFGIFDTGDVLLYDARPDSYHYSWKELERKSLKTRWRKIKIEGMTYQQPDW
jgi:hypothetical protein